MPCAVSFPPDEDDDIVGEARAERQTRARRYAFACGPHPVQLRAPFALPLPAATGPADPAALAVDWRLAPGDAEPDDTFIIERRATGLRLCLCASAAFTITADSMAGTFTGEPGRWRPEHRRDMLLLPALELALLPRGLLSLHAAAVAGDGWLALFLGVSGSGKSTAARLFIAARGGELLADDRVIIAGETVYGWPDNRSRPLPERLLIAAVNYAPGRTAAITESPPAAAGESLLAATRFAGLRGLPPGELPGAPGVLARLMALPERGRAVRVAMAAPDPSLFTGLLP